MTRKLSLFCLPLVFALGCSGDDEGTGPEETTDSASTDSTSGDTLDTDTSIDSTMGDDGSDSGDTSIAMTDSSSDGDATSSGDASDSGSSSDASDSSSSSDATEASVIDALDASDSAAESATDSGDATPPTSPEIWAVRAGDGAADLDFITTNIVVERIRLSDKMLLGTITLPTTGSDAGTSHAFTLNGLGSYEGTLTRSRDGHFVTMVGYDAPLGSADVSSAPRVIARIDSSGTIDTSTEATGLTKAALSVASVDGTQYWLGNGGGAGGGIRYLTHGSSGAGVTIASTNGRNLSIFGDVLYGTGNTAGLRIFEFPSPLPTTASTPSAVSGTPSSVSYDSLVVLSRGGVDTLYVCNEDSGGIERWTKGSAGSWSLGPTFAIPPTDPGAGSTIGCNWLAAEVVGTSVILVAVTYDDLGRIVQIVDDGATDAGTPTVTTIATGTAKKAYKGISFAPRP